MAQTVVEYVEERERECRALSLHHMEEPSYAVEAGSCGMRGRVRLCLHMTERAYMKVSELIEVRAAYVHRLEYAYYLIIDSQEFWARDFDRIHGYHGHTIGHERVDACRITFKAAAEQAWEIVSQEEELTGPIPLVDQLDSN